MTAAEFREHLSFLRDILTVPLTDAKKLRWIEHLLDVWILDLDLELDPIPDTEAESLDFPVTRPERRE